MTLAKLGCNPVRVEFRLCEIECTQLTRSLILRVEYYRRPLIEEQFLKMADTLMHEHLINLLWHFWHVQYRRLQLNGRHNAKFTLAQWSFV